MSDVGIAYGQGNQPGLPPINLPSLGNAPQRPRVEVTKAPDPYADLAPWTPSGGNAAKTATPQAQPGADAYSDLQPWQPPAAPAQTGQPQPEVSTGGAAIAGVKDATTFGLDPTVEGLKEASGLPDWAKSIGLGPPGLDVAPIVGAARMAYDWASGHKDPEVQAAYDRGRKRASEDKQAAQEQHPWAYLGGQLAGGLATPSFGAMRAGGLGARAAAGALGGMAGGGLYGAGSEISAGGSPEDVARSALGSGAVGAALGSTLGAALGRRLPRPASAGEHAAETAESLGAPLPRGVASDSRAVQSTTARLRQVPFGGERIGRGVERTQEAAGEHIGNIAAGMAAGDRASADAIVRPGLQNVIDANRQAIDNAYSSVRSQIDRNQRFTMPTTQRVLDDIERRRAAAGHTNPGLGLEQFRNVAAGATFEGAHRARVDAREAGNVLVPHPGYNAGDYNRLTRAMTADLRNIVHSAALRNPSRALRSFDQAEAEFGRLAEQNNLLNKLVNSKGEGAVATLIGAAREKGGNLRLLAQLRNSMNPADFNQIGGTLLHELGHNNATGQFSLAQFVTNWDKVNERAARLLFAPDHLQDIQDVVHMGRHIKGALRDSSTSHSANLLVLLDLAKDAALVGHDVFQGGLGAGSIVGAGTSVALWGLTHWLASPQRAAAMGAWSRAYRGLLQGSTPARQAAFNAATRNLARTLRVPAESILSKARGYLPARSEEDQQQ